PLLLPSISILVASRHDMQAGTKAIKAALVKVRHIAASCENTFVLRDNRKIECRMTNLVGASRVVGVNELHRKNPARDAVGEIGLVSRNRERIVERDARCERYLERLRGRKRGAIEKSRRSLRLVSILSRLVGFIFFICIP